MKLISGCHSIYLTTGHKNHMHSNNYAKIPFYCIHNAHRCLWAFNYLFIWSFLSVFFFVFPTIELAAWNLNPKTFKNFKHSIKHKFLSIKFGFQNILTERIYADIMLMNINFILLHYELFFFVTLMNIRGVNLPFIDHFVSFNTFMVVHTYVS